MRWMKYYFGLVLAILLSPVMAYAATPTELLEGFFDALLKIGSLSFLNISGGDGIIAFVRILIFILIFTILFAVLSLGNAWLKALKKNHVIVISLIITTLSTIFIPPSVLLAAGGTLGTLVSVLLLAAPLIGLLAIIFMLPDEPCYWNLIKLIIAMVLYWVTVQQQLLMESSALKLAADILESISQFWEWVVFIEFLIILYLLYKLITCGDEEEGFKLSPKRLFNRINDFLEKTPKAEERTEPKRTINLSPTPPRNHGDDRHKPNIGDDPTPPANPVTKEKKLEELKGVPYYQPKTKNLDKDDRIIVDLSPWFLSIRNQDGLGACAAFAGSSILEYIQNEHKEYLVTEDKLSELFLWFNARSDKNKNSGTYGEDLVRELLNTGVCRENDWPFEDIGSDKYLKQPEVKCYEDALNKRVLRVSNLEINSDKWIKTLIDWKPIYCHIRCPNNFGAGQIGQSLFEKPNGKYIGGHAMVIVGYDSHYQTKDGRQIEAFKLRNSWGSGWGEKGYIWIPKLLLGKLVMAAGDVAYVFEGFNNKKPKKQKFQISGRVVYDGCEKSKRIDKHDSGKIIVDDKKGKFTSPQHPFVIAIMAQIKGNLVTLAEEKIDNKDGKFEIEFLADSVEFEELTNFERIPQLNKIGFAKQVKGVIIAKKDVDAGLIPSTTKGVNHYSNWWFHIVDFKYSKGGRGGEGYAGRGNNPISSNNNGNLNYSGIPIQLGVNHNKEENVVIPVFHYPGESKDEQQGEPGGQGEENQEPKVQDTKQEDKKTEKKIKEGFEKLHDHNKKVMGWAMAIHDDFRKVHSALFESKDIGTIISFIGSHGRKETAFMRRLNSEEHKVEHLMEEEIKLLPLKEAKEFEHLERDLKIHKDNLLLHLQHNKPIGEKKVRSVRSAVIALKITGSIKDEDKLNEEEKKALSELKISVKEADSALATLLAVTKKIDELTTEK